MKKIHKSTKERESRCFMATNFNYRRMQNRESAVRSRMRKRYHQDDLEVKIEEMEKVQKEISEKNAGLAAQNALLKKQLSYFEDVFSKSSLVGFDAMSSGNVNRSDLEQF